MMLLRKGLFLLPGALLCASVAWAQNAPVNLFQLDGNAAQSPSSSPGVFPAYTFNCTYNPRTSAGSFDPCEYWNKLNGTGIGDGAGTGKTTVGNTTTAKGVSGTDGWAVRSFINGVNDEQNFTGGGSKDPKDLSAWKYTSTSTPPKDGLRYGYAAAYTSAGGDFEVVFGSNRASPNGDANVGIWFFQQTVSTNGSGGFSGVHVIHDVFVISSFTGGGGKSTISTYEWNPACSASNYPGFDPATSAPGSCADTNLKFLTSVGAGTSCTTSSSDCAITNPVTTHSTWDGDLITPLFFEGGVDITAAFSAIGVSTVPCFSSFLMETRSSQSTSAVLKDFLLGGFPVCSISVTKQCPTCSITSNGTGFQYQVQGVAKNTGIGTLYSVIVTDDAGTPNVTTDDLKFDCGTLTAGQSKNWGLLAASPPGANDCSPTGSNATKVCLNTTKTGICFDSAQNPATNTAHIASSTSSTTGGTAVNADSALATCQTCTVNPLISISKLCTTNLEVVSGKVVVRVDFKGTVTNTGNDTLNTVSVSEDQNADGSVDVAALTLQPLDSSNVPVGSTCTSCTLAPGQSASYVSSYYPSTLAGGTTDTGGYTGGFQSVSPANTGRGQFNDTTAATGTSALPAPNCTTNCFATATDSHTAHCVVCPLGACLTTNIN